MPAYLIIRAIAASFSLTCPPHPPPPRTHTHAMSSQPLSSTQPGAGDWSSHARKYNKPSGDSLSMPFLRSGFEEHFFAKIDEKIKASSGTPLQVLALCGGTGPESLLMCERYGDKIKVLSTDTAQGMVDVATETFAKRGYESFASARLMDAMDIDAPAHTYDVVLLILGPMLLPDANACFTHVARVLKPDGLFCTLTPGRMDFHDVMGDCKETIFKRSGRESKTGNVFRGKMLNVWGSPAALQQQLQRSGVFGSVDAADITTEMPVASEEDLDETLERLYKNPGVAFLYTNDLSEEETVEFKQVVRADLAKRCLGPTASSSGLKMRANCAWARL